MVESDADLAGLFHEDEFAEPALYLAPAPGASAVRCSVIVDRGQGRQVFRAGDSQAVTAQRQLWAKQTELATLVRGGLIRVLDPDQLPVEVVVETFEITGEPKLDQSARLWSADLLIRD